VHLHALGDPTAGKRFMATSPRVQAAVDGTAVTIVCLLPLERYVDKYVIVLKAEKLAETLSIKVSAILLVG
jgi:hypothetical protein